MTKEPTDEEVIRYITRMRSIRGEMCIEKLIDHALVYDKERQRDDEFHEARMCKCTDKLKTYIKDIHHYLYDNTITEEEFENTKYRMMLTP